MKKTEFKSNLEIAEEWDEIAHIRHQQIKNESDISFHRILMPNIIKIIEEIDNPFKTIIDIGCGTGYLTQEISKYATNVIGVDISEKSIEIANQEYGYIDNISFKKISIEETDCGSIGKFTLAVANMVLMDIPDLNNSMAALSDILTKDANFIFTITHPFFWSKYWGYDNEDWYNYDEEIFVESAFKISNESTNKMTSHIHRPLSMYFQTLKANGFKIIDVSEPMPSEEVLKLYPKAWEYPRFLIIHCKIS